MNESTEEQLRSTNQEIDRLKKEVEILRVRLATRKPICPFCTKVIEEREKICVYKNTRGKLTKVENFHMKCYNEMRVSKCDQ